MAPQPQPLYFGAEGPRLFGWLHHPAAGSLAGVGLVICNPFGFEEVCAHRSLRHIARAAADAGIPSLRFDYEGCGNSAGDEFAADTLGRWTRSVHEAIDCLRRASGVSQVCLLGVRLGATLAALAAAPRDDVAGLIAVAPVVRGRAYLRELTMLAQTGATPVAAAAGDGSTESAGFLLTRETGEAIGGVDLRGLSRSPAPRVLIVERDDVASTSEWLPALERIGADVASVRWSGYAGMMEDPQRTVVPQAIVRGVVGQLQAWQSGGTLRLVTSRPVGESAMTGQGGDGAPTAVREASVSIDAGSSALFGILTSPAAAAPPGAPAVLMLNSGSVHLIGPNRLWVRLARRWAAQGMTVLRIDLSGIGDSPARPGQDENVVYSASAKADIAAALAHLKTTVGAGDCHLLGLCSGGYHALKAAVAGLDIASSVVINPLTYFWQDGSTPSDVKEYEVVELTAKYRSKLLTAEPWLRLVRGDLHLRLIAEVGLRRIANVAAPYLIELARWLHWPLKHDLARELRSVAQRRVGLRFVFAAGAPGLRMLQQQAGRATAELLARGALSIDAVAAADHTFTRREARERLVTVLDGLLLPTGPTGQRDAVPALEAVAARSASR